MLFDDLDSGRRRNIFLVFGVAVLVAFFVGYVGAGIVGDGPTGSMDQTPPDNSSLDEGLGADEVKQIVQNLIDNQSRQQERQLAFYANQSENLSADNLSINSTVYNIEDSRFSSLYRVNISVDGYTIAQRNPIQLERLQEYREIYVSKDGKYMFSEPTDIQQLQQQLQQQLTQPET